MEGAKAEREKAHKQERPSVIMEAFGYVSTMM